jgi:hypothetical protein
VVIFWQNYSLLPIDSGFLLSYYSAAISSITVNFVPGGVSMAFTSDSTIADILKGKANAREIIEKHAGQRIEPAQLQVAMGMSIQQVANFVGWNQVKIEALLKDLNA